MPIDFERIRTENIARYGWDTAVLELLGQLYSDRSHFIFELIQNAEDAGATEISFEVFADRLEVRHNGRPFTADDVRGICGVGHSTKTDDLTAIGTFGIGFKSVYAYTGNPRIHSADVHFRIESFVHPYRLNPPDEPGTPDGGTRFVLPFDRADVPADVAATEIAGALDAISPRTLLFLRHIDTLAIGGVSLTRTALRRRVRTSSPGRRRADSREVTVTRRSAGQRTDETWIIWHRPLDELGQPDLRAEVALELHDAADARRLAAPGSAPLVVYFPTHKETFLGFWLQGPYRTTPARDNVPDHDPWNLALAGQTARLITDVLADLRDADLLTMDVLRALPLEPARFGQQSLFRVAFDAVAEAFATDRLIPVSGGGYASSRHARLADGTGLHELLPPDLLGQVCRAPGPITFADQAITPAGTPLLWNYLRDVADVEVVTPADALAGMTGDFLAAQSDRWIAGLYRFLFANQKLWQERPFTAPVLRLKDGTHVAPFDSRGRPTAYLPPRAQREHAADRVAHPAESADSVLLPDELAGLGDGIPGLPDALPGLPDFPLVRPLVAADPGARRFLEALGLGEPDIVAVVVDHVLPRYAAADLASLDPPRHEADLELLARALAQAPPAGRDHLLSELARTPFLIGENAASGEQRLVLPSQAYLRTRELETYLDGNPDAWICSDIYGPWLAQLRQMGVRDSIRPRARSADPLGHVIVADEFARHERGLAGFDPSARLDGLEHALSHPNAVRSEYVWNALLVPARHLITGVVEKSPRESFADSRTEHAWSPIGQLATTSPWLPAPDGTFRRPSDLDMEDLPPDYQRDEGLARALGMARPVIEEANRELGFPPAFLRRLSAHPDLVAAIETELRAREGTEETSPNEC